MEQQNFFKRNQYTFIAIILFLVICLAYFSPILEGRKISQSDAELYAGVTKEAQIYHEKTGNYTLWTNSVFGGMPTYQIWLRYTSNLFSNLTLFWARQVPNPINVVFLYLAGFFILLRTLRVNVWLSVLGAIAFAFSSYNFIIIYAGHVNKAFVIGLFAPTLAGVLLTYRGKILQGATLTAVALTLQIIWNHYQMSYYLAFAIGIYIIYEFIDSIKTKRLATFFKASGALAVALILAVGINSTALMLNKEYADETIRGKGELTLNNSNNDGLSKDYAFEYSYGIDESFTLLVPNFLGGASGGELSKKSETYRFLKNQNVPNADQIIKQLPLYWGEQIYTAGPIYFGAIVIFLFIFGLFIVKGKEKWWILTTVVLTIMLAWGKHFMPLSNFFFENFPMYNKFRAVSSILAVTSLLVPLLGVLALKEITEGKIEQSKIIKALRNSLIIVGGLLLIFIVMPGIAGSFSNAEADKRAFGQAYDSIISSLIADRESLFRADAMRSLAFILIAAGLIFAYLKQKLKVNYLFLSLTLLVLIDMWAVDKRYLNDDSFVKRKTKKTEYQPTQADLMILQDTTKYYRVYNLTANPFTDASTSYFHKSIGGYHAAKLKRYQELIENHLVKNNMNVLNMLNAKYFITPDQQSQQPVAQQNPGACGNAWFIEDIKYVANADSEMLALTNFDPNRTVIIDQRYKDYIGNMDLSDDTLATIDLISYDPMILKYKSFSAKEKFAVFSDIYYSKGWNAYIDGQKTEYIRVNYVLRGMKIPAGKHDIEFRFEPESYAIGEKISLVSSIVLILLIAGAIVFSVRTKQ
jgi:hypothetical protein